MLLRLKENDFIFAKNNLFMKKIVCLLSSVLIPLVAICQVPSTDIFIVNLKTKDGKYEFSKPVNITHREGYDNQPSFTSDGMNILYSSMPDTSQTDIFVFHIKDSTTTQLTKTSESEYSPVMTDSNHISAIRVDEDKAQRLYTIDLDADQEPITIIQSTDSAAYYARMNDSVIAVCVLNKIMDLHIYDLPSEQYVVISSNVGRCLVKFPGTDDLCFIQNATGGDRTIMRYNHQSGEIFLVGPALKGSEDFTIMPDGKFLMGAEGKLFELDPNTSAWNEIADFSETTGSFYRLVASPNGKRIALVSYAGKKP